MADLASLLERIKTAAAELDGLRPLDREREERVMQKFRLWWTYHSNAIEGNSLTQGETEVFLMEGLTAKGKPLKDHLDLKGHSEAINFLLALIRNEEAFIRELHKILLAEPYRVDAITPDGKPTSKLVAAGQYKTLSNHVRTPTDETHYYATPEETPAKMHDLMNWYREEIEAGTMPRVVLAARFHHRFVAIHPFDDGNRRLSRLLMNLVLMQGKLPPVVIRLDERNAYLAALRLADRGEFDEFDCFICEHAAEALELFIRAAKGEEVSEPTDLKKEIRLELLRLKHIEEPSERTGKSVSALFQGSITDLVLDLKSTVAEFRELFTDDLVVFVTTAGKASEQYSTSHNYEYHLDTVTTSEMAADLSEQKLEIQSARVAYTLKGFRKARFDAFDVTVSAMVDLAPFGYTVKCQAGAITKSTRQHLYQEPLTNDEIRSFVELVGRFLLDVIQSRTKMGGDQPCVARCLTARL